VKLHFGVIDVPYAEGNETTGDVAVYLENKYHVMGGFVDLHIQDISDDVTHSFAGALSTMMAGGPVNNPLASAESKIAGRFKKFLSDEELAKLGVPGVPTEAALKGVSHRFKSRRGHRRPSFIDTGQYQANAIVWSDDTP
jgi:hypothetical protein